MNSIAENMFNPSPTALHMINLVGQRTTSRHYGFWIKTHMKVVSYTLSEASSTCIHHFCFCTYCILISCENNWVHTGFQRPTNRTPKPFSVDFSSHWSAYTDVYLEKTRWLKLMFEVNIKDKNLRHVNGITKLLIASHIVLYEEHFFLENKGICSEMHEPLLSTTLSFVDNLVIEVPLRAYTKPGLPPK